MDSGAKEKSRIYQARNGERVGARVMGKDEETKWTGTREVEPSWDRKAKQNRQERGRRRLKRGVKRIRGWRRKQRKQPRIVNPTEIRKSEAEGKKTGAEQSENDKSGADVN